MASAITGDGADYATSVTAMWLPSRRQQSKSAKGKKNRMSGPPRYKYYKHAWLLGRNVVSASASVERSCAPCSQHGVLKPTRDVRWILYQPQPAPALRFTEKLTWAQIPHDGDRCSYDSKTKPLVVRWLPSLGYRAPAERVVCCSEGRSSVAMKLAHCVLAVALLAAPSEGLVAGPFAQVLPREPGRTELPSNFSISPVDLSTKASRPQADSQLKQIVGTQR